MRRGLGEVKPTGAQRGLRYIMTAARRTTPIVAAIRSVMNQKPGWAHPQHKPPVFSMSLCRVRLPQTAQRPRVAISEPPEPEAAIMLTLIAKFRENHPPLQYGRII